MAPKSYPAPTAAKIERKDDSGHFWMIQQGTEFYIEENAARPDLSVNAGEKKKVNRGAARNGEVLDRLAARLTSIEKLTPRK